MKKLIFTGALIVILVASMAGCTGIGMADGPMINSISAEIVGADTATPTPTPAPGEETPTPTPTPGQTPTPTPAPTPGATPSPTPTPSPSPTPAPGEEQEEQQGMSVQIEISVANFEVVDSIENGEGDGYYIYYLDKLPSSIAEDVPQFQQQEETPTPTPAPAPTPAPGEEQEMEQQQMAWASTETSFTWENLEPGFHIFSVQLVDADGAPLSPPVAAAAALTVGEMAAENGEAENDIVETAQEDGRFTTLIAALEEAGLVDTLKGEGPYTVFAPTDEAFDQLPEGTLDDLLADPQALTDVLTYHVASGEITSDNLTEQVQTLYGEPLTVSTENDTVMVNDAEVIAADVQASNGVIHVIDTVLVPEGVLAQ